MLWTLSSITRVRFPSYHRNLNKLFPLLRAHTQTHVWMFGRRFWWNRAQLSLPYNTAVFYSQLPSGCYMHFRSCVPVNPTPVLTLTGRRCHCALNVTAQVNLCPAVTASIEGCLSTRILNKLVLLLLMDSDPNLQIYHGALTSETPLMVQDRLSGVTELAITPPRPVYSQVWHVWHQKPFKIQ